MDVQGTLYIHSICEVNDTTLWMASVGGGIYNAIISGSSDDPEIKSIERYTFVKDEMAYNFFFTALQENDSIIWFGNRGQGLRRLNLNRETFDKVEFRVNDIPTVNDILSIYKDRRGRIWVGTSFGILKLLDYNENTHEASFVSYNESDGLPNNTIHGILEDKDGSLWLSTNGGVVRFDPEAENFRLYNYNNGLSVFEFSDGAYYKDEATGTLFFGGINGFITISPDVYTTKEFVPQIFFTELKVYENEYNLNDFIRTKNNRQYLELDYSQNFFSVSFVALDYIDGQNCRYFYNIENLNTIWIDNGNSNVVNLTNISPGEYVLHVKCTNGDFYTDVYSLPIVILPPWYMATGAYLIYFLLFLAGLYITIRLVRRKYRHKWESMMRKVQQQKKEEIYESKLRFFTNITHEFSTPLTLIYGPCDRIISYDKSDGFIKRYAGMIKTNAERLNTLIQELIEFRRIETGHKTCIIQQVDITELSTGLMESFTELAEVKKIDYLMDIDENTVYNTDKSCFQTILTNLLSNAFKYTPDGGEIRLSIGIRNEVLEMVITNTGKGITAEDLPYIFDRYRVLDNIEKQSQKDLFSRNGLGLAICYSMVKLLDGEIKVKSIPDEFTEFRVTLPVRELTTNPKVVRSTEKTVHTENQVTPAPVIEEPVFERSRPTIFVIEDDPEIRGFISEIMNKLYNVVAIGEPLSTFRLLEKVQPHLIISDVMMPDMDGITLMKQIKADKKHLIYLLFYFLRKIRRKNRRRGLLPG
ncbi:MAG: ATP-binding protein [Tannerellaceae bacterium]|nr:response regulator [Tannerellaceae bacterium]MCD8262822.1 ATP-binding protein [Tannerellaceae bacterium]